MICVDLPIYQAKARKAQKFNAAPKVGPGFPSFGSGAAESVRQ